MVTLSHPSYLLLLEQLLSSLPEQLFLLLLVVECGGPVSKRMPEVKVIRA